MKRMFVVGTALAAALTCSAYAQQGSDQSAASSQNKDKDKEVTVTGCLTSGSPASATAGTATTSGTAGTSGSTAGSASPNFILTNAVMGSGASSTTYPTTGATGTSGTAGTSGAASASGPSYQLTGGQSSELEGLVNSKVEIKGTLDSPSASTSGASGTMPGGTSAAAKPQLRITSVKQVAATCSGQ